jgi:plastocyanin
MMSRIAVLIAGVVAVIAAGTSSVGAGTTSAKLTGVTGPGSTISVKRSGVKVRTLKAGRYTITVADKSTAHNFRLRGPGLNRQITGLAFKGSKTVTVMLRKGTYTYLCDPHAALGMKGTFRST